MSVQDRQECLSYRRRRRIALLAVLLLGATAAVDALWVEPYWIEVTHHALTAPVAAPLKIAHLTDLHTHGLGRGEKKLLALLEEEKPDLIVITGDTIASGGTYPQTRELLSRLHAPLGVWLVRGNWENWRPLWNERTHYAAAGVKFLVNESGRVREDVWLAGVDDPVSGAPDLDVARAGIPPGAYVIALFHAPAYFDRVAGRVPLSLAGHSHGGQVRLPWIGPLWLPRGTNGYVEGWFDKSGSRMYVSRGVGMSILPVRFFCRPEVAFITIRRSQP